ncbi:MAG TPA: hypothetical protein VFZ66_13595 [Herpetosiphonaceae bacterium]
MLTAKDRYLDALAPSLLASNHFGIWPKHAEAMSTQKLWEAFVQFPYLPMLADKQVVIDAIDRGCREGLLGYAVGDEQGLPVESANGRVGTHNPQITIEIAPTSWIVTAAYAREHLVPRTDPVGEIPVELLVEPSIWPSGSARRRRDDLWAALVQHDAPRPIEGRQVLSAALKRGMEQGLFQIAIDGDEPTGGMDGLNASRMEQLQGVELVRPSRTRHEKPRLLTIDVSNVDLAQLSKITTGVIVPLKNQGARVSLRLVIEANAPDGIAPEVIDLTIKETFKQLGLAPDYQQSR